MGSTVSGLSAKTIAPSPGPEYILPPYKFSGSLVLSAATTSSAVIPLQTLSVRSFEYVGPVLIYGSGNTGTGVDGLAGVIYQSGVWRVYTATGQEVNYKAVANSTATVTKAGGSADGWSAGAGVAGDPKELYIRV
jgi:hypothetical protein